MREQRGCLYVEGGNWVVRWRDKTKEGNKRLRYKSLKIPATSEYPPEQAILAASVIVNQANRTRKNVKMAIRIAGEKHVIEIDKTQPCPICLQLKTRMVIDHDHITNRLRSVTCGTCNSGMGMFGDNPQLLLRAAKYLIAHKEQVSAGPA